MAKYLDYAGLQYLWAKIKNYVSTQPLGANVRYDQQSLTTAQQAQARANIMAGGSNDNLLDNAYFVGGGSQLGDGVFPINQRGQTSYSEYTNSIDRWYAAAAMTVAADGISCGAIVQKLPQVANLNGKTLTFSALMADGTMLSGSAVFNSASDTYFYSDAGAGEYLIYNTYFGGFEVVTAKKIAAVKLEVGTVSTLANDPVPDFWEELEKCQHYLWVVSFPSGSILSTGYASGGSFITDIILPTTIRESNLALTFNANALIIGNGTAVVAASVIGVTRHGNHLRTYINPASALTNQNLYAFVTSADTVMAVSAEL